jgi:hypothetical protein
MTRVVLAPFRVAHYPKVGGHFWVYVQYAEALRRLGCDVWWLEELPRAGAGAHDTRAAVLLERLAPFGLAERVILYQAPAPGDGQPDPTYLTMTAARAERVLAESDLLLNFHYEMAPAVLARFRRTALVDIDPGLLQLWWSTGELNVQPHDVYFSIGEHLGEVDGVPGAKWVHTRPAVALELWPYRFDRGCTRVTCISSWRSRSYVLVNGSMLDTNKRAGFVDFLDLPRSVGSPMEIATVIGADERDDRRMLREHGWVVHEAASVIGDPTAYQSFIQGSRAEFGCAKPAYVMFGNAWVSDRTACYLASGKPAVVQHTGPSDYLPDGLGLIRFSTPEEAAEGLAEVDAHYERHCHAARQIAEECFSARKVVTRLLHHSLPS